MQTERFNEELRNTWLLPIFEIKISRPGWMSGCEWVGSWLGKLLRRWCTTHIQRRMCLADVATQVNILYSVGGGGVDRCMGMND